MVKPIYKLCLPLFAVLSLFTIFNSASPAREKDILKFETGDTLEEIRYKIAYNGYSFEVGENWVTRLSPEERDRLLSRHYPLNPRRRNAHDDIGPLVKHLGKKLPSSFDWRNYNGHSYIGPIQNQANCGACYAFGAAAAAEGTYNWAMGLYDGSRADFSEAFIAFCLSDHYSAHFDGCDGADYDYYELQALLDYGICSAATYPYTDHEEPCPFGAYPALTKFQSWYRIPCGDIDAIKTAIMTYGVVDAAINAGPAFDSYSGGPFDDTQNNCFYSPCYYIPTNHAISLVGWDDNPPEGGGGVWILRNSWGTSWGESGYMRCRFTAMRVACEVCYLVHSSTPTPSTYRVLAGGDYNGDNHADIAVFRPSTGLWSIRGVSNSYFGNSSDIPVPGDYNGNGTTNIAIFRPSTGLWSINGADNSYFGDSSDIPVPGDYNGNGTTQVGIFRSSNGLWAVKGLSKYYFGDSSDIPVPGDYNGNGTTNICIFRESSGLWASPSFGYVYLGTTGDIPVPGDYNGYIPGSDPENWEAAIFRPSTGLWSISGGAKYYFGNSSDKPVPGDYNGNGTTNICIFRDSTGLWSVRNWTRVYHGASDDIPVTR